MTAHLLVRRAASQIPLLAAVLTVVTIGASLLGACTLLLTVAQDQALREGLRRAGPEDTVVTAQVTDFAGKDAPSVEEETRSALLTALAPLPVHSTRTWTSSVLRPLRDAHGDGSRKAYLASVDPLANQARLTQGRWPDPHGSGAGKPRIEAAVLESTAERLGLKPGDETVLGAESTDNPGPALTVKIVGILRPEPGPAWSADLLAGAGFDPALTNPAFYGSAPAYGPFLVTPADLRGIGAGIDRMLVSVVPDLTRPSQDEVRAAVTRVQELERQLSVVLEDRAEHEQVTSALTAALERAGQQQRATRSTVLVLVLLGTVLCLAAMGLATRLVQSGRQSEAALLTMLGADRRQVAALAAAEAFALAIVAMPLSVLLSSLAYAGLTHLPRLARAGLAGPPVVTWAQSITVLAGAFLLVVVLVMPALRPESPRASQVRGVSGTLSRSGIDLVLLVLAGVGWWQLRSQPSGAGGTDAVRELAPALCLVAGAAIVRRLLGVPLRWAERRAGASAGLVLPLAALESARRPRAAAVGLVLALAAGTGGFGLALSSTWEHSQHDQAALRVGADVAVNLIGPLRPGQARTVVSATGGTLSGVTDREVLLGSWSDDRYRPKLLAVEGRSLATLARSRLPGGWTWADVGRLIASPSAVTGLLPGPGATAVTFTGRVSGVPHLQVVIRPIMQDEQGLRTACTLPAVALDGRAHLRALCPGQDAGARLIALNLALRVDPAASPQQDAAARTPGLRTLVLDASLPTAGAANTDWEAQAPGGENVPVLAPITRIETVGATTRLRIQAGLLPEHLTTSGVLTPDLVSSSFETPEQIRAVISQKMADEAGMVVGDRAQVIIGQNQVPVTVSAVLPDLPAAPGAVAMLVDADSLSRSLIVNGDLDQPVDALWVAGPTRPGALARLESMNLGTVTALPDVTDELRNGPLRIGMPATLRLLLLTALLLALAGTILHTTADLEARAVEIGRLRGLGMSRREIRGTLLAQHATLLALLLGGGLVTAAVTAFTIAPALIRSDLGTAPAPAALAVWPWGAETLLMLALLIICGGSLALVIGVHLRRSAASHLKVES